ncbi:Vps5 C terminal like-domain-containing protein [Mycena floridula]|nr:Vps5 C terminal like-domain-containing protein [Mycena floridula]
MDSFDDLLAPSRRMLEENPFSDPFAKRSSSPDPWATPYQADEPVATFTQEEPVEQESAAEEPAVVAENDPLDSATLQPDDEDDNEPLGRRLASPGFRESVAPPPPAPEPAQVPEPAFSEIATIRPTEPEETIPAPAEPLAQQPAPKPVASPTLPTPTFAAALPDTGGWQSEQDNWSNDRPASRFPTEDENDSEDDKPIGQIVKESSKPTSPQRLNAAKRNDLQPIFVITVDDPQKVGDPIRGYIMYTVHTRTTSPLFQKSAFSVLRRYSDFLWLYETLSINNPGVVVPPVPEKSSFGRFDDQFVRQRRFALEKCIQKIANHPELGKDADMKMFLESDTFALDIKHRKAEIANEKGGLMASLGLSLSGYRFWETDEWFDRQKGYLDSLESQLRGLVKAIEIVSRQRQELALATGEFAQAVGDLSASDIGKQLSHSLAGLAEVERRAQDIQSTQSDQDMVTLMGTVDEYARLINSVRLAFSSRIRTHQNWKNAETNLLRVKQSHESNRAQGRSAGDNRLSYSLSQIAEAERRTLEAKHEFEHVSKLIKSEVARFEQERIEDFKDSLHAFLEGMISRQKELIAGWENYQQMLLKRVGGGRGLPEA